MYQHSPSAFAKADAESETQARSGNEHVILKASVVESFEAAGLKPDELYRIIGFAAKEQIVKRVQEEGDLTPEQSEKVSRIAHIVSLAERVFKNRDKAFMWLRAPNSLLGDKRPLDSLTSESGARFVEEALIQLEYGVYG